jgi:hypothetical protein
MRENIQAKRIGTSYEDSSMQLVSTNYELQSMSDIGFDSDDNRGLRIHRQLLQKLLQQYPESLWFLDIECLGSQLG